MKKLLVILMLSSIQAYAGDYSTSVKIQELCENVGKLGATAYSMKMEGMSLKELTALNKRSGLSSPTSMQASVEGYNATNAKSAYMNAWAVCMDKYSSN